jgi:lipoprotein NlpI
LEAGLALTQQPDNPEIRVDVGLVLLSSGNASAAFNQFEAALGLRLGYAEARFQRGAALWHLGRSEEAKKDWAEALLLDPHHRGARLSLESSRAG